MKRNMKIGRKWHFENYVNFFQNYVKIFKNYVNIFKNYVKFKNIT